MGMIIDALKSVFKTLTKLSRPQFTLEENELKFKIDSDKFCLFPISSIETKTRYDPYVLDAYTMRADDIYIEYIHTDTDVTWNGGALSYFLNLLKHDLDIKTMVLLEKKEFKHYEFLIYKIDDSYILNFIYIYEINKEVLIIDLKGELYESLISYFHINYVYKFEKGNNASLDLNTSLVKNNAIYGYFKSTSEGN